MAFELIDISRRLNSEIAVWPGSRSFERRVLQSFEQGGTFRESEVALNIHTGTHMDAPAHFVRDGVSMDGIDLRRMLGRVSVVDVGERQVINREFLATLDLGSVPRVLFKTRNSRQEPKNFDKDFVAFTPAAAAYLKEKGLRLVGIDGPSVQSFHDKDNATHEILLGAGIVVLEGLMLGHVVAGIYTLLALPLKIEGAEGAPLRAVLLKGFPNESFD